MSRAFCADAPAKVNLCLHVTGQRADGYHLLDTLVGFCAVGDVLTLRPGPLSLNLTGPESTGLAANDDNLILRAARLMGAEAAIALDKRLPVAAGIGGGSADAAAAMRGLAALTGAPLPQAPEGLGADLPMCLASTPLRAEGIGELLTPVTLPPAHLVLANPRVPVSTPDVFRVLECRENPPLSDLPAWPDAVALAGWLHAQRNDLEAPARSIAPVIEEVLDALSTTQGCLMARMSGSGATCFGLYASATEAQAAMDTLPARWWRAAGPLLGPTPQLIRSTT